MFTDPNLVFPNGYDWWNAKVDWWALSILIGEEVNEGYLSEELDSIVASGSGRVITNGTLDIILAGLSLFGEGQVESNLGYLEKTLDSLILSAIGSVVTPNAGTLEKTFENIILTGEGIVTTLTGSLEKTLESIELNAVGKHVVYGTLQKTLTTVIISATGEVTAGIPIEGELDQTLAALVTTQTIYCIYDRTAEDISNKVAKAYFNVVDWERINRNCQAVVSLLKAYSYPEPSQNTLETPTITTISAAADINELVENINNIVTGSGLSLSIGLKMLPLWTAGAPYPAPDYDDVNDWERNLCLVYFTVLLAVKYSISCGVAEPGQSRFWQYRWRR